MHYIWIENFNFDTYASNINSFKLFKSIEYRLDIDFICFKCVEVSVLQCEPLFIRNQFCPIQKFQIKTQIASIYSVLLSLIYFFLKIKFNNLLFNIKLITHSYIYSFFYFFISTFCIRQNWFLIKRDTYCRRHGLNL
jgi:hypothetical protein